MESVLAYVCNALLPDRSWHFLWLDDDVQRDAVLVDQDGRIPAFADEASARAFARRLGIPTTEEPPAVFDLLRVMIWCDAPQGKTIDPELFLNTWNLLTDIRPEHGSAVSLFSFEESRAEGLYDKLFFANNLPSVTPVGSQFLPEWDDAEIAHLSTILRRGLAEFTTRLRSAPL